MRFGTILQARARVWADWVTLHAFEGSIVSWHCACIPTKTLQKVSRSMCIRRGYLQSLEDLCTAWCEAQALYMCHTAAQSAFIRLADAFEELKDPVRQKTLLLRLQRAKGPFGTLCLQLVRFFVSVIAVEQYYMSPCLDIADSFLSRRRQDHTEDL